MRIPIGIPIRVPLGIIIGLPIRIPIKKNQDLRPKNGCITRHIKSAVAASVRPEDLALPR